MTPKSALLVLVLLAIGMTGADATVPVVEYDVYPTDSATDYVKEIVAAPDGQMWFSTVHGYGRIAMDGAVTLRPFDDSSTAFGIAVGEDGNLWMGRCCLGGPRATRVTTADVITDFTLADIPENVVAGPDGRLWFLTGNISSATTMALRRFATNGTALVPLPLPPLVVARPVTLTVGADGRVWFTERLAQGVAAVGADGSSYAEYPAPTNGETRGAAPLGITRGADGAMWYTESLRGKIARITADGSITTQYDGCGAAFSVCLSAPIPGDPSQTPRSSLTAIITGPDGNLWFTDPGVPISYVGRLIPDSGRVTEYPLPHPDANMISMAVGPDGAIWFTTLTRIGRILPPFIVTASAGAHGTINPAGPQDVNPGDTIAFVVTPDPGYVATVTGCGGTLAGSNYATPPITANCNVVASFTTAGATATIGGTVAGLVGHGLVLSLNAGAQTLPVAGDGSFTFPLPLADGATYDVTVAQQPTGPAQTCSVANGHGVVSTANIANPNVTDVRVTCTTAAIVHVVTPSAGSHGAISPATPQSVADGGTVAFTLLPDAGYAVAGVTGSCAGTLAGNVFITAPVLADCTVVAGFFASSSPVDPVAAPISIEALAWLTLLLIGVVGLRLRSRA